MTPAFSIITPSYKQLDWLQLACASVVDQTGVEVEHIVQDAGSNGIQAFFAQRIAILADNKHTVHLQVERDAGMYDGLNRGFGRARGNICAYLNCDEQLLPGALRQVGDFFAANPTIGVVFGDVILVDAEGQALSYRRAIQPCANHIRLSHLNTLTAATFFKRELFQQGHRFDPQWKSIGDAVWIYTMLKAGIRFGILPYPLSVFTFTGANDSVENPRALRETLRWRAEPDAPSKLLTMWYVVRHRLQKLAAGAYRKRTLNYEIYTLKSTRCRQHFTVNSVGGRWTIKR